MKKVGLALVLLLGLGALGYWVLITPDNPLTRLFRREISDTDARIIIGPYPGEADFRLLKANHVELVVSLLDPSLPYEKTLLEREQALAQANNIRLLNFPMTSVLGQKFGENYQDNASAAADAIATSTGKIYLHCYLGLHRIQRVRDLLDARGIEAGKYSVRQGEREQSQRLLDAAEADFRAGRYEAALAGVEKIEAKARGVDARLLQAWSHYRLGHNDEAMAQFKAVLETSPEQPMALAGEGYAALRSGDAAQAERYFSAAVRVDPKNPDALGGWGLSLYRMGKLDEAEPYLDQALAISPDNQDFQEIKKRIDEARAAQGTRQR